MQVARGKRHKYLETDLDLSEAREYKTIMINYMNNMVEDLMKTVEGIPEIPVHRLCTVYINFGKCRCSNLKITWINLSLHQSFCDSKFTMQWRS